MLLTNRRHRLLFMSLAAMDIAVGMPFLALLSVVWNRSGDPAAHAGVALLSGAPLAAFAVSWAILLGYMVIGDLLNRSTIQSPRREVLIFTLLFVTWLTSVALLHLAVPGMTLLDRLAATGSALFNFTQGLRGELLLLGVNFFLWWRVARYTDRDLTFFSVGLSFRLGMLLALLGNSLMVTSMRLPETTGVVYFVLFFAFGLAAVALARIDEKAVGMAHSTGALLPWSRLVQIWITIVVVLGMSWTAALLYTPASLRSALRLLAPLGFVLQWLLIQFAFVAFWLLSPFLKWLTSYLRELDWIHIPLPTQEAFSSGAPVGLEEILRQSSVLRYCLVLGAIVGAALLVWLFFVRTQLRPRGDEQEEQATEESDLSAAGLRDTLRRLRNWRRLVGSYGIGPRLLDAISVENIYANLTRLAKQRGYPRPIAQAPDTYLPTLNAAFPGYAAELERITAAYLRVHYGEHPIAAGELYRLRADYLAISMPRQSDESRPPS